MKSYFLRQSWKKDCRQIKKLSKIVFLWIVLWLILCDVLAQMQNLSLGWPAGYSPINTSISWIFLKINNFLRTEVLSRFAPRESTPSFIFLWK